MLFNNTAFLVRPNERNEAICKTESRDLRDNAIAEFVNGVIENEYLEEYDVDDIQ